MRNNFIIKLKTFLGIKPKKTTLGYKKIKTKRTTTPLYKKNTKVHKISALKETKSNKNTTSSNSNRSSKPSKLNLRNSFSNKFKIYVKSLITSKKGISENTYSKLSKFKSNISKQTHLFTKNLSGSSKKDRSNNSKSGKIFGNKPKGLINRLLKSPLKVKLIIGSILLIISLIVVLFSNIFALKENGILIERLDDGSNINLIEESLEPFIGKSIFRIDKNEIKNEILKYQKNINNIEISRLPLNGLRLKVTSYEPLFKTRFKDRNPSEYLLLENGVLIGSSIDTSRMPVLDITSSSLSNSVFLDYEEAIDTTQLFKIYSIYKNLLDTIPSDLSISKMHFFQIEEELHVTLSNKLIIFFDLNTDVNLQLSSLININKHRTIFLLDNPGIIYINLGIFPSVAVCDSGNDCYNNLVKIYGDDYK